MCSPAQRESLERTDESAGEFAIAQRVRAHLDSQSADVSAGDFYRHVRTAEGDYGMACTVLMLTLPNGY